MQQSDTRQVAKSTHRQVGASTTLNRKYVKRPVASRTSSSSSETPVQVNIKTNSKISKFGTINKETAKTSDFVRPAEPHPTQVAVNRKLRENQQLKSAQPIRPTAKELKDQAIKKALAAASKPQEEKSTIMKNVTAEEKQKIKKVHFGFGRVMLALTCAAAAVFAIVYFVGLNMPDMQFRAAAMQLNANYPNYLPRDYSPTEIVSEGNVTTMTFRNHTTKDSFSIIEEKSSWDSNSLLNNFVKEDFGDDYTVIREQGLTIYIGANKAAWVNGGVVYKLNTQKGSLTKKQISSIAVSL